MRSDPFAFSLAKNSWLLCWRVLTRTKRQNSTTVSHGDIFQCNCVFHYCYGCAETCRLLRRRH